MVREKAPNKRQDNDLYETQHWCIDLLAERLERTLPTPDWVVDLGAGDGRIGGMVRSRFGLADMNPDLMLVDIDLGDWQSKYFSKESDCGFNKTDVLEWFDRGPHECIRLDNRVLYVGNPPFSLSHEFVWRAVDFVKNVYMPGSACAFFLRAGWWIGGGYTDLERVDWFNQNPPDAQIGVCPRPSFVKGTTDNSEYAWYVWMHGAHHGTQMEVALKDRKAKQKKKEVQGCLI